MAGYPYTTQVEDAPTRKSLIAAFDQVTKVRSDLEALLARVDALETPPPAAPSTTTIISTGGGGGGGGGPTFGSFGPGDLLGVNSASTIVGIPDVIAGNILRSGGINTLPSWGKLQLAADVMGVLPVNYGGTGLTTYAVGDLLYASGVAALSRLADVATGNALLSGGVGVAPSWGKIGLTTHISGTLAIGNGGTGASSLTNGRVPYVTGGVFADDADLTFDGTTLGLKRATFSEFISTYQNVATVGWGVPAIYGTGRQTAQTAAVASLATYTVGGSDGSFLVSANVQVTAATTASFTVAVDYTDETNTARTLTLTFSQLAGTLLTTITNVTGTGPYEGIPLHIRAKASTQIKIYTTGSFVSVTYNVEGAILQVL